MLTGHELADVVRDWRSKTKDEKQQIERELDALRNKRLKWATATEGAADDPELLRLLPGLEIAGPERSAELAADLARLCRVQDALPAIELAVLQRLHSPKVAAWDMAARILAYGLEHSLIKNEPDLKRLFSHFWAVIIAGIAYPDPDVVEGALLTPKAEQIAVTRVGRKNGLKPHANHIRASGRLAGLWNEMKQQGMPKSKAAPEIAKKLGLAESTVRKKLQGM